MILKFNRVGVILISALVLATVACGGAVAPEKPLLDAVREGDIETVRLHMLAGTRADDVMIPTGQENTGAAPLHIAVLNNNLEMVKVLVEGTATLEHKMLDDMGLSPGPLSIAAWYGYPEIAEYLLSMGADKNYWDGDLCTPLCAATIYPHMEDGLPPHAEDTEATMNGRQAIIAMLEAAGGNMGMYNPTTLAKGTEIEKGAISEYKVVGG